MERERKDRPVLGRIQDLVDDEHRLYEQGSITEEGRRRLADLQVELDRCWDLLRQRRALREIGEDPARAQVRPADVVERYEQ
jgi:hypothetical protein